MAHDYKTCPECTKSMAARISHEMREKHGLTYRAMVNIEGAINNMIHGGMKYPSAIRDVVNDILENVEFIDESDEAATGEPNPREEKK